LGFARISRLAARPDYERGKIVSPRSAEFEFFPSRKL
jgi:hypothetical protein